MIKIRTASENDTFEAGVNLGKLVLNSGKKRCFIALYGDLGAGKTVFTRGIVSQLSPGSRVKSPTYTIVNEYLRGRIPVYHFDFYRIEDTGELDGIGFDDYLFGGICISEWSDKLGDEMPKDHICVTIEKLGEDEREITLKGMGKENSFNVDLGI